MLEEYEVILCDHVKSINHLDEVIKTDNIYNLDPNKSQYESTTCKLN